MNHEKIHLKQQVELLVVPFYLIYLLEFVVHFIKTKDVQQAYMSISFEREAYKYHSQPKYLTNRRFWAMWR